MKCRIQTATNKEEGKMATVAILPKEHSSYCNTCGKFEFDTKDIGHLHDPKDVLCTGWQSARHAIISSTYVDNLPTFT